MSERARKRRRDLRRAAQLPRAAAMLGCKCGGRCNLATLKPTAGGAWCPVCDHVLGSKYVHALHVLRRQYGQAQNGG